MTMTQEQSASDKGAQGQRRHVMQVRKRNGDTEPVDVNGTPLRVVHVPGWIGAMKVFRWLIPHVIEAGSRFSVPKADRAALAYIENEKAAGR